MATINDLFKDYNDIYRSINSNKSKEITDDNVSTRVRQLYMLVLRILDTIIIKLLNFVEVFIGKVEEQDAKIALQKENLDIQDKNLRIVEKKLDMVKEDLSRTKHEFNENMKKYNEKMDNLANKLIVSRGQDISPINNEIRNSMYLGGKTRRDRKHHKN